VPYINRLEKICLDIIFLAGNFDDHTLIIPKLIFSSMAGESLDAGITFIVFHAHPRGTRMNICIYLIFLETRIIGLHFAANRMGLSLLKFFWWAP